MGRDPARESDPPAARGGACPICGKPVSERDRPFCSRRCANVDLQRWLVGAYAIPVAEEERDPDDPPAKTSDDI